MCSKQPRSLLFKSRHFHISLHLSATCITYSLESPFHLSAEFGVRTSFISMYWIDLLASVFSGTEGSTFSKFNYSSKVSCFRFFLVRIFFRQ